MGHHVIRVQTQQHRWENGVVINSVEVVAGNGPNRLAIGMPAGRQARAVVSKFRVTAQYESFGGIVASAVGRRKPVQLWMHQRTVIALRIVLEDQLPIARYVVMNRSRRAQRADFPRVEPAE